MNVKESLKLATKSRTFIALTFLTLLQTAILMVFVFVNANASELQVPVHYSSFSSVQFYRDQWYYLLIFAFFALTVFGLNTFVALKLFAEKGRSIAVGYLWLTVAVLAISTLLIMALLRVASI